ncbi:MAG: type VI secretion system contractile sheath small subunit [Acidobacteriota bacterium]|jgi:type VI secretion system protein ImpB|nr:type VI secretion system contractile sheath small subunit [Acidobacteriota bacterium]MDQ5837645.1 type VI secretion system contractile sheath small subunit [Acidobacteriota bacterium]
MPESTQHKLDRVRPPRVQITYDVEIGDAIVMKELPFVVGIMADLSGKPAEPLPPLKERKYVEIDRDNFNDIMKAIGPRLALRVDNRLTNGDTEGGDKMNVELKFASLDDFSPINVLKQVEALRKLFDARTRLADLLAKLDGNDALDALLQDVVKNTEGMQQIKSSIGGNGNG